MLNKRFKAAIRSTLRRAGLDIRQVAADQPGIDPLADLQRFVGNRERPVLFDVGANIGQTIDAFRNTFPAGIIHSFEPGMDAFAQLQKNCAGRSDLQINNLALGSQAGNLEFIESVGSDMSSFLEPTTELPGSIKRRVAVPGTTLDAYCEEHRISQIDVLKTDTQGFDLEVLNGAESILNANAIHLVLSEINFSDLFKKAARLDQIYGFLADLRMKFITFYRTYYHKGRADWTEGLFVNEGFEVLRGTG